jgi:type III restriction enzyme
MRFKFNADQEFQIRAIESVTRLLDGQPRIEPDMNFALGAGFAAVSNRLDINSELLLQNLRAVQRDNSLTEDETVACLEENIITFSGTKQIIFPNFSVEMETGTGKTYVYIRTALEFFRRYGLRKYIVVVPSVAIREGVLKTLQMTENHLRALYDNIPYRYYAYDSANLSQVRQFALSDSVEMMIMTIDSFNKASNVIRLTTDRLQGETPIHLVQATRPILILDEPQNMESELRIKALAALDPLFALRYSATHRNPYSLVYRLTPFEAYRQGLVKRIEVAGVVKPADANEVFLRLDAVRTEKKTLTARLAIHKLMKDGTIKEQTVIVKPGDELDKKANRPEYAPFSVEEIDARNEKVLFANGVELRVGEAQGADKEKIFETQIRYTIEEHFRKQRQLRPRGIKVLSLFFIDRVDNYARKDGIIRQLFDRCFNEAKVKYSVWENIEPETVQAAYFAQRRTKSGDIIFEDSKTGEAEKDRDAYDLIMRDKERLLSFDDQGQSGVAFIFSHSALREGWDNPNVFQICTLNQTASEMKKRQEIGRGVRLSVDQTGERIQDDQVNILTVIANESYEHYVERLQTEMEEEYGKDHVPPPPADARKRGVARLRKAYTLKPEFKELWDRIKHKTRYSVMIDSKKLIDEVVKDLNEVEIKPPRLVISKARFEVTEDDHFTAVHVAERRTHLPANQAVLPNLIEIMTHLLTHTTPPVYLTRQTLLSIFKGTKRKENALENPYEFATTAVHIIRNHLMDQLVDGIKYEKINEWYEMTQLEAEIESWSEYLVPAERSVYDQVIFDSDREKQFVEGLDNRDDVKLYLKLPAWFTVPTPVGEYNPDWAIVIEKRDEHGKPTARDPLLYLVRETKDTLNIDELRPEEKRKVKCGSRHFSDALQVDYKVVTNARELF